MKRSIRRCLLAVALAVTAPLPVLWWVEATAQDFFRVDAPKVEKAQVGKEFNQTAEIRLEFAHDWDDRTRKLLSHYGRTDDEKERANVLDELTKVVSEQFDSRQGIRERELKKLEENVRKLRELHQRRAKEKDQIVRDRVRQLLRDVDGLGWGDDDRLQPASPIRESAKEGRSGDAQR